MAIACPRFDPLAVASHCRWRCSPTPSATPAMIGRCGEPARAAFSRWGCQRREIERARRASYPIATGALAFRIPSGKEAKLRLKPDTGGAGMEWSAPAAEPKDQSIVAGQDFRFSQAPTESKSSGGQRRRCSAANYWLTGTRSSQYCSKSRRRALSYLSAIACRFWSKSRTRGGENQSRANSKSSYRLVNKSFPFGPYRRWNPVRLGGCNGIGKRRSERAATFSKRV